MRAGRLAITAMLVSSAFAIFAQSDASHTASTAQRDRDEEKKLTVALFTEIRQQGSRTPKSMPPTDLDLQLTCTVAIDPNQKKNAEAWGLTIIQAEPSEFPNLLKGLAKSARATDEPSISIVAFRKTDIDGKQILTLGFSKVESHWDHMKGCLFTEDGCGDRTWQKSVAPACKGLKH